MSDIQHKPKILIVDDELANLYFLKEKFSREYQPLVAENAKGALAILENEKNRDIALIIADESMDMGPMDPGLSGTELLKESIATHPNTIRWLISAYFDNNKNDSIYDRYDIQIDRYLKKPLREKIDKILIDVKEAVKLFESRQKASSLTISRKVEDELRNLKNLGSYFIPGYLLKNCINFDRQTLRESVKAIDVTIIYAGIRNYNSLSHKLSPDRLFKQVNDYLGEMSGVIVMHKGTIMQYTGAGILAVFACEKESEKNLGVDAQNAIRCSVEMKKALQNFNRNMKSREIEDFVINIGINSGEAAVGCLGSEYLLNYTVIGNVVTRATLLPGRIENAGGAIILSSDTFNRTREAIAKNYEITKIPVRNEDIFVLSV